MLKKHIKLFRKFLGNIARPRYGVKNNLVKAAKGGYLLVGWIVELIGDIVFAWKKRQPDISRVDRLLIIKPDQLGDVLFSTFLLPIIKNKYPDAEIDYLVHPKAKDVLEKNPHISHIYFWEDIFLGFLPGRGNSKMRNARFSKSDTIRRLRERRYDVIINARGFPPSSNFQWRKIGGVLISFDISEMSFLADYWADYSFEDEEWKNYLNLLAPFGINTQSVQFKEQFFNYGENPIHENEKYAVISPITFDRDRKWSDARWMELISYITSNDITAVITGTQSQRENIGYLTDSTAVDRVKIFTDINLGELGSLVRGAEFFVGIDSFPAHLAIAFNKKSLFFVNTDIYFLKNHSRNKFARDARCMLPLLKESVILNVRTASVVNAKKFLPFETKIL